MAIRWMVKNWRVPVVDRKLALSYFWFLIFFFLHSSWQNGAFSSFVIFLSSCLLHFVFLMTLWLMIQTEHHVNMKTWSLFFILFFFLSDLSLAFIFITSHRCYSKRSWAWVRYRSWLGVSRHPFYKFKTKLTHFETSDSPLKAESPEYFLLLHKAFAQKDGFFQKDTSIFWTSFRDTYCITLNSIVPRLT